MEKVRGPIPPGINLYATLCLIDMYQCFNNKTFEKVLSSNYAHTAGLIPMEILASRVRNINPLIIKNIMQKSSSDNLQRFDSIET